MSRAMVAPYLCAVVNALAALALATILAPGVSLVPTAAQATYAADHLPAWRLGWGLWIAAALSLVAFFGWWASRIAWPPVARAAVVIAVAGVLADMIAEGRLIAWSPGQRFDIDGALRLSGIGANGSYSLAGAILTWRTRGLPRWLAQWSWAVWVLGIGLAVAVAAGSDTWARLLTAGLFALLVPWLVVFGRRLA